MYSSQGGNIPSGVPVPGEDLEHRGGRGSNPNRKFGHMAWNCWNKRAAIGRQEEKEKFKENRGQ